MHNNIDKPPVARSATTTDVENPFHTHLNSTSKFWTVPYGSKIHEFMLEKFKIYQGRVFQDIREHFCSIRKEEEKEYWKDISAAYVISADKPTGKVVKIPTKLL